MLLRELAVVARTFGLPVSDAYDAASFITGKSYAEAKSSPDIFIDEDEASNLLKRWEKGEPTAYITGRKEFYGREFKVTPAVLIPRPETEILVEAVLDDAKGKNNLRILDLCIGSGCIILSLLAEEDGFSGKGVDTSSDALDIAKWNARNLGLSDRVEFIEGDASDFQSEELFDIIVCNPPYIGELEYESLQSQVKFEPKIALAAPDDGLFFYKKILSNIRSLCKSNGVVFFEIGFLQGKAVSDIAFEHRLRPFILKDLSGLDRVIKVYL